MITPPFIRGLRCAIIFLTRVPVGGDGYRDADWRWSTAWFPAVGALIGTLLAILWTIGISGLSAWVVAGVILSVNLLLTGGFHEDGLADTADALGGGYTVDRVLTILKDSRVGAFGAMALFCALIIRVALWVDLTDRIIVALVLSQCLSRVVPIWLMGALPYVTRTEAAKSRLVTRAGWAQVTWATFLGIFAVAISLYEGYLSLTECARVGAAMGAVYVLCHWRFKKRIGGITGDFLGAAQQVSECAILMGLAWGNAA